MKIETWASVPPPQLAPFADAPLAAGRGPKHLRPAAVTPEQAGDAGTATPSPATPIVDGLVGSTPTNGILRKGNGGSSNPPKDATARLDVTLPHGLSGPGSMQQIAVPIEKVIAAEVRGVSAVEARETVALVEELYRERYGPSRSRR